MTLCDKLNNSSIPIKIVGIWQDHSWTRHNLQVAFEQIGDLHILYVPADRIKDYSPFGDEIISFVEQINPDLVFSYVNNRHVEAKPFLIIKELGIPTINLFLDDVHKFRLMKKIAYAFTLNITTTKYALPWYEACNAKALYLPEGSNPISYLHLEMEKDIDVSFVGQRYRNRPLIQQALQEKGYNVRFCGRGWLGGYTSFEQMIEIYNRSKIVIGVSRVSTNPDIRGIKGRDFEATMCGAFYLCEENPELYDWFTPGEEIVFWKDIPDLLEKVEFYLRNDVLRESIANAALERSLAEHTWIQRLTTIFQYLKENRLDGD